MRAYTLNKTFSDKVMEYMSKGYYLLPTEMNYLASDYDSHVEMTNNKTIIRIVIRKGERVYKSKELFDSVYIIIQGMPIKFYNNDSFWNKKETKIIEKIKLYEVEPNKFYLTENEYNEKAVHIHAKRSKRYKEQVEKFYKHVDYEFNTDAVRNIVYSYIARQPRCKTIKKKDITSVYKTVSSNGKVSYIINAKGKGFELS